MSSFHQQQLPARLAQLGDSISKLPDEYRSDVQPFFDALLPWALERQQLLDTIAGSINELELQVHGLKLELAVSQQQCSVLQNKLNKGS